MTQHFIVRIRTVVFATFLGLGACGPMDGQEGAPGADDGAPAPESAQAEGSLCTSPSGCIGNPVLWRKTGVSVGPCVNGTVVDKGTVTLSPASYIAGTYFVRDWTNPDGYTYVKRNKQLSYSKASKVWVCESSRYVEYGYAATFVHRHKDYFYACYGAACQFLGVIYGNTWESGHNCSH